MLRIPTTEAVTGILRDAGTGRGLTIADLRRMHPAKDVRRTAVVDAVRFLEDLGVLAWNGPRVRWTGPLAEPARPLGLPLAELHAHQAMTQEGRIARIASEDGGALRLAGPDGACTGRSLPFLDAAQETAQAAFRLFDGSALVGSYALAWYGVVRTTRRLTVLANADLREPRLRQLTAAMQERFHALHDPATGQPMALEFRVTEEPLEREVLRSLRLGTNRMAPVSVPTLEALALLLAQDAARTRDAALARDLRKLVVLHRADLDWSILERGFRWFEGLEAAWEAWVEVGGKRGGAGSERGVEVGAGA